MELFRQREAKVVKAPSEGAPSRNEGWARGAAVGQLLWFYFGGLVVFCRRTRDDFEGMFLLISYVCDAFYYNSAAFGR